YVWWMWPGPGNLVWFTAFGLGDIGYVNASLPVPISISTGVQPVKVEQGTSQAIPASITDHAGGPVYLNVSTNGHDGPFGSPPLLRIRRPKPDRADRERSNGHLQGLRCL